MQENIGNSKPLVSVCCITYNHAPFIRRSIEGMLMQQTTFPIEILIHDDCSTDGTTEIVKEYAAKYPDLIFPLYEEVNQYQNGKAGEIDFYNYKRACGKYIAYCEGDDYWTDPLKLQKQVEFMEAHEEYSICFHEVSVYDTFREEFQSQQQYAIEGDFDITTDMFVNGKTRIGQPLSMVFRKDKYDYEWQKHYRLYCDSMEIFHLLRVGKGRFMRFVGGQYNLQKSGVSATNTEVKRSWEDIEDYMEMWNYTHDPVVLEKAYASFLWRLDVCKRDGMNREYWRTVWIALMNNTKFGMKVLKKAIRRSL